MLDARLRPLIDPPLNRLGQKFFDLGISANSVTLFGFGLGLLAAVAIACGAGAAAIPSRKQQP